ncbi:hypothetical protein [Ruegeria atlantica]|uniref:Integrase n=1 Tax=Ruegeria atlantica TaxID=81569 RepID=A0A0P1EIC4_9RHOB|nr:hypothetical protein [Ruegeria atlantica]CUH49808.1 hypothetical protein RUA4292_04007 [Ruegeria atlantica]
MVPLIIFEAGAILVMARYIEQKNPNGLFRRTFLTTLAELGIGDAMVADAMLNHRQSQSLSGPRAAYNHASLWNQKVRVMDTWANLIEHAVEKGSWQDATQVVSFRRPA